MSKKIKLSIIMLFAMFTIACNKKVNITEHQEIESFLQNFFENYYQLAKIRSIKNTDSLEYTFIKSFTETKEAEKELEYINNYEKTYPNNNKYNSNLKVKCTIPKELRYTLDNRKVEVISNVLYSYIRDSTIVFDCKPVEPAGEYKIKITLINKEMWFIHKTDFPIYEEGMGYKLMQHPR